VGQDVETRGTGEKQVGPSTSLPAPPATSLHLYSAFPSLRSPEKGSWTPSRTLRLTVDRRTLANEGGLAARNTRKPRLLFRLSVLFLLRAEERNHSVVLFHEPPRSTRCTLAPFP
jgi:hypothetical protein